MTEVSNDGFIAVLSIKTMPKSHVRHRKVEKILYYRKKSRRTANRILKLLAKNNYISTEGFVKEFTRKWEWPHNQMKDRLRYLVDLDYCQEYILVSNPLHQCNYCKSTNYFVNVDSIESAKKTLEDNKLLRQEAKEKEDFNPKNWFYCKDQHVLGRLIGLTCAGCNEYVESHRDDEYKIRNYSYWTLTENGLYATLAILKREELYDYIKNHTKNKILNLVYILLQSQKKEYVEMLINSIKQTLQAKPMVSKVSEDWYDEINTEIRKMKDDKVSNPKLKEYKKEIESLYISKQLLSSRRFR